MVDQPKSKVLLTPLRIESIFRSAFVLIALWLAACLYFVNIDFDDGYSTIINAQYFGGISDGYAWQRGPLLGMLLLPAEWAANILGLAPLNVRPHHAIMAVVHCVYFWAVWRMLARQYGSTPFVLIAFIAAIPTVVFFSYAPFISHDIFPGALALYMLILTEAFHRSPTLKAWLALLFIGAALAMIKQTLVIVWAAILMAALFEVVFANQRARSLRTFAMLCAAALVGGILTFLVYATVLSGTFHNSPWWIGPWEQSKAIMSHYGDDSVLGETFYQWIYLRNLSAYGMLASVLVIPALVYALYSQERLLRMVAVVWIIIVFFMQLIEFKEVRYLAFLAPMTAFLVAPMLANLWKFRQIYVIACMPLLLVDVAAATTEASRVTNSYYRQRVTNFFEALPLSSLAATQIVMASPLSFVSPEKFAFFGDRYHRITHIGPQLGPLYGFGLSQFVYLEDTRLLDMRKFAVGDYLIFSNNVALRVSPFRPDNAVSLDDEFVQLVAIVIDVDLRKIGDQYALDGQGRPIMFIPPAGSDLQPVVGTSLFNASDLRAISVQLHGDDVRTRAFEIRKYCKSETCSTF